jgi:pyruvate/2-oxoglutarate/acetoin dehydrogenase E1 component
MVGAVAEASLENLDDVWVLGTDDTPVPYSPPLEDAFLPGPDKIVAAVRERLGLERPELTIGTRS